jgi:glycosyltransferase involved in cell wall biosynthesis
MIVSKDIVILHLIDSLGIGGAEKLLVTANVTLSGYRHIVVHLNPANAFEEELSQLKVICLNYSGWRSIPKCVNELRKIINNYEVQIVHSHLYYAMIIARLACRRPVNLISSYHSLLYDRQNHAQYSSKLLLLDKLTYRERYHLVYVSETVKDMVSTKLGVTKNQSVIHNFVDSKFFVNRGSDLRKQSQKLRVVMVGNLRQEKNHLVAIEAVGVLDDPNIELDIYGEGNQRKVLEYQIESKALQNQIKLKGAVADTSEILTQYDLFVAPSRFEGFGIALVEAMAAGVPCLASDIPAHCEVAEGAATFFKSDNPTDLANKLSELLSSPKERAELISMSKAKAQKFSKENYIQKLEKLYKEVCFGND